MEKKAKAGSTCLAVNSGPVKAHLHPWEWPAVPWQCIHLDVLGPFMGKTLLVAADSHSKWTEVLEMSTMTAAKTATVLREMFARFGLPEQVVTDNRPQFTSSEFSCLMLALSSFIEWSSRAARADCEAVPEGWLTQGGKV